MVVVIVLIAESIVIGAEAVRCCMAPLIEGRASDLSCCVILNPRFFVVSEKRPWPNMVGKG